MEIVHKLTMYLDQRRLVPCVDVVQCDANTRVLELTLLSGGEAWEVPSGMGVAVAFRKSDGTAGLYDVLPDGTKACSYSGNVVRAVLAPQVLTAWGKVEVAVVIQDPNTLDRVATFPLCVEVARDPSAGKGISNDYYRCTSLGDVNEILDGFDQELEEFRGSVRPYAWTVTPNNMEVYGWDTFLDLPTYNFYRLAASLPASFGLPVAGSAGTLVAFDASNYEAGSEWFVLYVCTQLVGTEDQIYVAYTSPAKGLEAVAWRRIRDVSELESQVAELESQVSGMAVLDKCIRPFEWNLNSGRTGEGKTWPTIIDLPANQFYRFVTDVPDSFGLPVSGVNGTLVVFDAGSDAQDWYKFYICTALVEGSFKTYFAYANTMDKLVWKEVALNTEEFAALSAVVGTLEERVEVLDACIRPYEWSLNSSRTGEGKLWPTIFDLPSNQFYKFITDVPASFGLPVTGLNGTLVVFDASNSTQSWYRLYLCSVLLKDGMSELYFTYADPEAGVSGMTWHKVAMDDGVDLDVLLAQTKRQVLNQIGGMVFGNDRPKIVLLGDSIMAGVGSSDYDPSGQLVINKTFSDGKTYEVYRNAGQKSWAALFEAHMEATYPGCQVVNNGVPGYTHWYLANSMDELVPDDTDIAIVQLGTNSRNNLSSILNNTGTIIDYLVDRGITPIVMTNTVLVGQTAPNDAQNVRQCILQACTEKGVYCYDVLGEMEWYLWEKGSDASTIMADDLHPNDQGHELICQIYRKSLRV